MKYGVLIPTIILSVIGIIMIYSSSQIWALYKLNDEYYYLYRQSIFFILGIGILIFISRIDTSLIYKYASIIFLMCLFLLIIVLIPGIGIVRGGARSWIGISVFQIQPAEFMKIGLLIITSKYLSKYDIKKFSNLIPIIFIILLSFLLIMLEPDLGTGIVMLMGIFIVIFTAGLQNRYIILAGIAGVIGATILIIIAPYRLERITSYLNPWSDPLGSGFQTIQSLYAISPGGLFGLGLFKSRQKFYYLPEPHTDFIFACLLEELGLIGGLFVFFLFFILFFNGIKIAIKTKNKFNGYLALGITFMIFIQFFINIGVVIGLLPVTGITLPFISYGGSSLILNYIMIGILLGIERKEGKERFM